MVGSLCNRILVVSCVFLGVAHGLVHADEAGTAKAMERFEAFESAASALGEARMQGNPAALQQAREDKARALDQGLEAFAALGDGARQEARVRLAHARLLSESGSDDLAAALLAPYVARGLAEPGERLAHARYLSQAGPGFRQEALDALGWFGQNDAAGEITGEAQYLRAKLLTQLGLHSLALPLAHQAADARPGDVPTRILLAGLEAAHGEVLSASNRLDALGLEARPYDAETRVLLRNSLHQMESEGRVFPDTAENHAAYTRLLYRAGRPYQALLAGQRATQLDPGDTATWNQLGAMYAQLGNLDSARKAYESSLLADPGQPGVRDVLQQLERAGKDQNTEDTAPSPRGKPAPLR